MGLLKVAEQVKQQQASSQPSTGYEEALQQATPEQKAALANFYRLGALAKEHGWDRGSRRKALHHQFGQELYDTVQTLMDSPLLDHLTQQYTENRVGDQSKRSYNRLFNSNGFDRHQISDLGSRENFPEMMATLAKMADQHYTSSGWERPTLENPNPEGHGFPPPDTTPGGGDPTGPPVPDTPPDNTPPTNEPPGPPSPPAEPQPSPPGNPDPFQQLGGWGYRDAAPGPRNEVGQVPQGAAPQNPFMNPDGTRQGAEPAGAMPSRRRVTDRNRPVLPRLGTMQSPIAVREYNRGTNPVTQADRTAGLRQQADAANADNRAGSAATQQERAGIARQMRPGQQGPQVGPPQPGGNPAGGFLSTPGTGPMTGPQTGPPAPGQGMDPTAQPPVPGRPTPPQFGGAMPIPGQPPQGGGGMLSQPQPTAQPREPLDNLAAMKQPLPQAGPPGAPTAPVPADGLPGLLKGRTPGAPPAAPDPNAPAPGPFPPRLGSGGWMPPGA